MENRANAPIGQWTFHGAGQKSCQLGPALTEFPALLHSPSFFCNRDWAVTVTSPICITSIVERLFRGGKSEGRLPGLAWHIGHQNPIELDFSIT